MKPSKFLWIFAMIVWSSIFWHTWSDWGHVLNVGVIALSMVDAVCRTIRDAVKEAL